MDSPTRQPNCSSSPKTKRPSVATPPLSWKAFWRSLAFNSGLLFSTLILAPVGLCFFFLPYLQRYRFLTQWARFNLWWLQKTCGLSFRVRGQENLPPGPAVILCKHQSAWETLALQEVFPPQVWVLKRELLWIPLFGWCLALLNPIAIDRRATRKSLKQVIEQGRQRLASKRWVVIFPEGTRMAPGVMGRFGMGAAALSQASGYPVVPVAHNAGRYWPRSSFTKYPGTIELVIGPTISPKGKTAAQINQEAHEWMAEVMREIDSPKP
jgi:1-acyl-sn-glycerol-3-phosphate acyltransferase